MIPSANHYPAMLYNVFDIIDSMPQSDIGLVQLLIGYFVIGMALWAQDPQGFGPSLMGSRGFEGDVTVLCPADGQ